MAHIEINTHPELGAPAVQLFINGIDYSLEAYANYDSPALVDVGEEAGLRLTICVSSLKINGEVVQIANHFNEVAGRIQDMLEATV